MYISKKIICLMVLLFGVGFSNGSYAIKGKGNSKTTVSSTAAASKSNVALPISHRFDVSFSTAEHYLASLQHIHDALGSPIGQGDELDSLFINAPDNSYSLVNLVASDGWHQASLVMRNRDWYVVGFISGGIWFSFSDTANFQLEGLEASTPIHALSSHYSNLVRVAEQSRPNLMLSAGGIDHAIIGLHTYGNGQTPARQLARSILLYGGNNSK